LNRKDENQLEKMRRKTPMQYLFKPTHALLALATVLALTLNAVAQSSGTLDPNFGTGGTVTTDFGAPAGLASVAVQPDGKIVAAGTVSSPVNLTDFALSRYNTDGTLDASFGVGGKVTTDFAHFYDFASSVAIQQDGKIIVAGGAVISPYGNFALARYNSDGTLDASFGTGGKVTTGFVTTEFGQVSAQAYSVAVQQDGKIVVAGEANIDGGYDFALVRYNSNGTLDASFGTGGRVTTDFDLVGQGFSFALASSVAIQPDGKIVAAGDARLSGGRDFALARYNSNGTLDASFGTGGRVTTDFSGSTFDDFAESVAVQQDGKIVAVGGVRTSGGFDFALVRYNSNGTLDATFGTSGKVTTDFASPSDQASFVAIQQDGSIVAVGRTFTGPDSDGFHSALAHYNSNGTLDAGFGTGGKVTNIFGGQTDGLSSVAIQQDGKIVAAGGVADFNGNGQFALARFLSPSPTSTPTPQVNFALATNGGVASASSQYSDFFPVGSINNGDRKGLNWGFGGGWNDFTANFYPDWVQISFNASKTIGEIDVFTIQDVYTNPAEPTEGMTFSYFGITEFDVQYWDGFGWVTVPGGSITNNNKVWTKVVFSPVQTTSVRVLVKGSLSSYSRIIEVEAWGPTGS
jgi:uncharacterized delta-60 repeat protein